MADRNLAGNMSTSGQSPTAWNGGLLPAAMRPLKDMLREELLSTTPGYRLYLKWRLAVNGPLGCPAAPWENTVLQSRGEWEEATNQVRCLGLLPHIDAQKHWDNLCALDRILRTTNAKAWVLDAGAETYSVILPWLFLYGYRNLVGINLEFDRAFRRGPILYEYGDLTRTRFKDGTFDAVTCLSVIEHGVELEAYFREMARLLKPGGFLITSTDYYPTPIDTRGFVKFGAAVRVFTRTEIMAGLDVATRYGLYPTSPVHLDCMEKPVTWKEFDLSYSFLTFTLRKGSENRKSVV